MKKSGKILITLEEIAIYSSCSKNTILKRVEDDNFPATKVDGRWESNTDLIDSWQRRRIEKKQAARRSVSDCFKAFFRHIP